MSETTIGIDKKLREFLDSYRRKMDSTTTTRASYSSAIWDIIDRLTQLQSEKSQSKSLTRQTSVFSKVNDVAEDGDSTDEPEDGYLKFKKFR